MSETTSPRSPRARPAEDGPPLPAAPWTPQNPAARFARAFWTWLGSFGLAVTLLLALLVLVLLATFEQQRAALFDVVERFFGSWFLLYDAGPLAIPLPGGLLVLVLLSVNLLVGGVIRLRKKVATVGILVAHLGVLLLFAGSLVESLTADKGQMTVLEGESADEFVSYDEWEAVVRERAPSGAATEWVLPHHATDGLSKGQTARFTNARLPFDVVVSEWARNAQPRSPRPDDEGMTAVDGWVVGARPPVGAGNLMNFPGCRVTLVPKEKGPSQDAILWGFSSVDGDRPWVTEVAGRRFEVDLRQRRWTLPFTLELRKFVHETYPGTSMPSRFSSFVRKHEDGVARDVHITMNEPLRRRGYTNYQSSWRPDEASGSQRSWSTFSVVWNPMDRLPLVNMSVQMFACAVIGLGLGIHFVRRLVLFILHDRAERAAAARSAA